MKTVYEASNTLDAHMILNVIEQSGISGWVDGEYLQGGIGEIQAMGIVRVLVNDNDYQQARDVVAQWEAEQPDIPPAIETVRQSRYGSFALGLVVGFVLGVLALASVSRF